MIASAPGKIILFGEHAVVYGRHAIVSAVNLRCKVEVRKASGITIRSQFGVTGLDFDVHPYVSFALKRFSEIKNISGAEIIIESEIPPSSGLGSSAAVTVATLKALDAEFEAGLSDEDIFELAKQVEIDVQGRASGIDPFISTFGKSWLFPEKKLLAIPYNFFVIYLGEKSTAEMVARVARLKERYPEVIERIFDAIDAIALEASDKIDDFNRLKELIAINQSLLRAIGVSTPQIDALIAELEDQGYAAKITGAGGGGCVFGIAERGIPAKAKLVKPEMEGVRIEDS